MKEKVTQIKLKTGGELHLTEMFSEDGTSRYGKIWREYDSNKRIITEDYSSDVRLRYLYDENGVFKRMYDPQKQGAVIAIRIFFEGDRQSRAELIFAFDKETQIIDWTNPAERNMYSIGINGYTVIYDERFKEKTFDSWR